MPAVADDETDAAADATERYLVSPENIAYLKWLIFSAAFKEPFAEPRGATHLQIYLDSTKTFACKENIFRRRLFEALEIWNARFPQSKKCGSSLLGAGPQVLVGGAPINDPEHEEPASGAGASRAVASGGGAQ